MEIVQSIITIIINGIFYAVLNMKLYTDRAMMPDGEMRIWHRSPISRLAISDRMGLFYLQIGFALVSVIAGILVLFGVKSKNIKIIQRLCIIASVVMFIMIMVVTGNTHVKYA